MSERKPGWYWVKDLEGWKCAEWRSGSWYVGWYEYSNSDFPFDEIGPRIPATDEPWQCVPSEATPDMLDIQTLGYHTPASKRWRETLAVAPKP